MFASSLRKTMGNRCGEKAGRCRTTAKANGLFVSSSVGSTTCYNNLILSGPAHRTGPKAQVSLEYYLLLLGVSILLLIALTWASGFTAQQKAAHSAIFAVVANTTNSTLLGLAASSTTSANYSDNGGGLAVSINSYDPYWADQPALFVVEMVNSDSVIKRVGRLSITVSDSASNAFPVYPDGMSNFTIPFVHSDSFVFSPNSTGTYMIDASLYDTAGNILVDADGYPIHVSKTVIILG